MNTSLSTWLTWFSPASGQMSDYMDAQCDGTEHADKLATLQQLQKCRVGESTMMGFQHLCFYFDRTISISTLKKKKSCSSWMTPVSSACFPSCLQCSLVKRKKEEYIDSTYRWQWQNEKLRLSHSTGNHNSSCTRVYELESVYKLRSFSRRWAECSRNLTAFILTSPLTAPFLTAGLFTLWF